MVKLKRLKINQYRNVRPGTELHFDDGVNLVLGQNGSGKTTLLALLSTVCRSTFTELADEVFNLEFELFCPDHTVVAQACHRRRATESVSGLNTPSLWDDTYTITITNRRTGRTETIVSGEPIETQRRGRTPLMMDWSFIAATLADMDPELSSLRASLFVAARAFRFDESLECFAAATGRQSMLRSPATPPPALAASNETRDSSGGVSVTEGTYVPGELGRALASSFRATGRGPELDGAERPLAEQIAEILGVASIAIVPNVRARQFTPHQRSYRVEGFTFDVTRKDGSTIHHDRLSYGQKRLLAFFYYLAQNESIVIADELVNGLHHRWLEACMDAIGDRQAFLTSQNPLLFEYVRFHSVEQVQTCFVTCKTELVDGAEQLVWQNMPRPDAISFFESYKADIESVGDILITRGLW
jgi:energy-coupling factor transporter ATP-binding protein EcfA2